MMTWKSWRIRWISFVALMVLLASHSGCRGLRWFGGADSGASLGSASMDSAEALAVHNQQDNDFQTQPVSYTAPTQAELSNAGPFSKTSTGLSYRVLRPGQGRKPRSTDRVQVHYHGWLDNGSVFDSSYRRGSPTSFPLNKVVPGWTEGLQYVAEGGKIELEIPSHLGYGPAGGGGGKIPPNATLHFVVELLAINP